jgi:hypothetical protein
MDVQEPILINQGLMMQFFASDFFASQISQWISPHGVHRTDHEHPTTPIARVVF